MASLPPLVSGRIPPTATDLSQLAFFWRFDGEAGRLRVARAVAGLSDLSLFLPPGIDLMGWRTSSVITTPISSTAVVANGSI